MHQLSVLWHIISLKISSWSIVLWTKRAQCFNEISPNSSCQFWNHNVTIYSNLELLFSVTKDKSSVLSYLNPLYFGKKEPIKVKFSNFWVLGWKITKFLMLYLKLQVSFSLNFASLFSDAKTFDCSLFWLLTAFVESI